MYKLFIFCVKIETVETVHGQNVQVIAKFLLNMVIKVHLKKTNCPLPNILCRSIKPKYLGYCTFPTKIRLFACEGEGCKRAPKMDQSTTLWRVSNASYEYMNKLTEFSSWYFTDVVYTMCSGFVKIVWQLDYVQELFYLRTV